MTDVTKPCRRCGADVVRPVPAGSSALALKLAESLPALCVECERIEVEEEANREREAKTRGRIARCGVPEDLRGFTFDDLETDDRVNAIDAAQRWTLGRLRGLMLAGPVGVGKTRIAATAAWQSLDHRGVRWLSTPLLFARLAAKLDSEERQDAIRTLTSTVPLVLDDLDKVRPSEYAAEHVFLAIDRRVQAGAPLLVTTNLDPDELAAKFPAPFGEAIASRLIGYCEAYRVAGRDRREDEAAAA